MHRKAKVERITKETKIILQINLDGSGKNKIFTGVAFFDHMLELFSFHSGFDIILKAKGDIFIDDHHLVEDVGLVLGEAFLKALKTKKGIKRYAEVLTPMDESLSYIVVDISGRPYLDYDVKFLPEYKKSEFNFSLIKEFLRAFVSNAKITLHVKIIKGENNHHISETIFKGLARVLKEAVSIKSKKLPSTKGKL
ncbi:MAG: imidazoleglycerol-phosphate dehydratase HisB [Endomicrobia bacterium]|nr:imidazoleglycerol-phosphate dehydratase HisB [Endomicrobiia bacterium]